MKVNLATIEKKVSDVVIMLSEHMKHEDNEIKLMNNEISEIKQTIYGDKEKGIVGMNEKVDDIHTLLIQAKGFKWLFNSILLIAAVLAVLKTWFKGGL